MAFCKSYPECEVEFVKMRTRATDERRLCFSGDHGFWPADRVSGDPTPTIHRELDLVRGGASSLPFGVFGSFPRFGLTGAIKPATCG